MKILGVIPARYGSTRFEGKPLVDLKGKSMIQRVVEQCKKTKTLNEVLVATDDHRIFNHVESFGGKAIMTNTTHKSGTDRCAEAVDKHNEHFDYIINIQGDEPLINPAQIDLLGHYLMEKNVGIITQARPISQKEEIKSPNVVKVVVNQLDEALYFSRSPIPYERNERTIPVLQHIGIYGFKTEVLQNLVKLKTSEIENIEALEQLRWLDNGYKIYVLKTNYLTIAIDSPQDVKKVLSYL